MGARTDATEAARGPDAAAAAARCVIPSLVGLAALASCVGLAWITLFSTFREWDDEGYFLLALRDFSRSGGLYERFATPYGPFYFETLGGLFRLSGLDLDSTNARFVTGAFWVASAAVMGWAAWAALRLPTATSATPVGARTATSTATGAAVVLAAGFSFAALDVLANEPLHPNGLLALLLALLVRVSIARASEGATWRSAALGGAIVAALALVKPNVGGLAALAVGVDLARRAPRFQEGLRALTLLAVCAAPPVLMSSLLREPWVASFAVIAVVALAPFALVSWSDTGLRSGVRVDASALSAGFAVLTAVVIGAALATGTTLQGLALRFVGEGVRFPGAFVLRPHLPPLALVLACALFALGMALAQRATRRQAEARAAPGEHRPSLAGWRVQTWHLGAARAVVSVVAIAGATSGWKAFLVWPLLWVLALPSPAGSVAPSLSRLAMLAAFQALQVYPVAGSQVGLFRFLLPLVGVLGLAQAARELPDRWSSTLRRVLARPVLVALLVVAAFAATSERRVVRERWRAWSTGTELGLPGTRHLRLPEGRVAEFASVVANLEHGASTFVAVPGLHSFHVWSNVPAPVPFYPHTWPLFWDAERQLSCALALERSDRAMLLENARARRMWLGARDLPRGPLQALVADGFDTVLHLGAVTLGVRRGRAYQPVACARPLVERASGREAEFTDIALHFAPRQAGIVARLVVVDTATGAQLADSAEGWSPSGLRVLTGTGSLTARAEHLLEPFTVAGSGRLDVRLGAPIRSQRLRDDAPTLVVRVLDSAGHVLARLPLEHGA